MRSLLIRFHRLTERFWVVPFALALVGLAGAVAGIAAERRGLLAGGDITYSGGPSGASTLLGAIAAASIGVAGTVFSVSIAALSYTASYLGPRLLDNFTRDRGNQLTLGTFIATFVFSMVSLRDVREDGQGQEEFVPSLNVSLAMVLALLSVVALVYFIAHVTDAISTTAVIHLLSEDLTRAFRSTTRHPRRESEGDLPEPAGPGEEYRAHSGGYVQYIDSVGLAARCAADDVILRFEVRAGSPVYTGSVIATGHPRLPAFFAEHIVLGPNRTTDQDIEFAVRQLYELAVRALSPGINDPMTAVDVLDHFANILCTLGDDPLFDGNVEHDGAVRVLIPPTTYAELVGRMFRMIRQSGAGAPVVAIHMLEVLGVVAGTLRDTDRLAVIRGHIDDMAADALAACPNGTDLGRIALARDRALAVVSERGRATGPGRVGPCPPASET